MTSRFARPFAICAIAGLLAWADLPGQPTGPATLISRVDIVATIALLAILPGLVGRRYGPVDRSRVARCARLAGCGAVVVLVLVKAAVQRSEYATMSGSLWLAGIWVGEAIFLAVLAAYMTGMLAATAQRPPVSRSVVTVGTTAGGLAGLLMYMLPPRGSALHITTGWLASAYQAARVLAVPVVLAVGIAAGVKAARRAPKQDGRSRVSAPAKRGMVAGLFAGLAAATTVSILGISTIALVPHEASALQWTLPIQDNLPPGSMYEFEQTLTGAVAGYLVVFVLFPLLGACLGAWGGLYAAERPGRQQGGGGGGGPKRPDVSPRPPAGGRQLEDRGPRPVTDMRRILSYPEWQIPAGAGKEPVTPVRRERIPAGVAQPDQGSRLLAA